MSFTRREGETRREVAALEATERGALMPPAGSGVIAFDACADRRADGGEMVMPCMTLLCLDDVRLAVALVCAVRLVARCSSSSRFAFRWNPSDMRGLAWKRDGEPVFDTGTEAA